MRLRDDEVIGNRVETVDGRLLGRLAGFVLEAETGFIVQYRVHPRGFVAWCLPGLRELLVHHDDVVSIDTRRMVVRDGTGTDRARGVRRRTMPSVQPQPLSSPTGEDSAAAP